MEIDNEKKIDKEDSYKNLERVNFWINNSDCKASFVLAFIGAFISIGLTSSLMSDNFKNIFTSLLTIKIEFKALISLLIIINLIVLTFFVVKSVFYLLDVLTAKIDIKEFENTDIVKDSKIFFASIAASNFNEFNNKLNLMDEKDVVDDLNSQIFINSKICTVKFEKFNKAIQNAKKMFFCFIVLIIFMFIFNVAY